VDASDRNPSLDVLGRRTGAAKRITWRYAPRPAGRPAADQIGFANLSNRLFCLSGVRIRHAKLQAQDGVIQFFKIGAAKRIRTPDPRITNALLYQLSYCGIDLKRGGILPRRITRCKTAAMPPYPAQHLRERENHMFLAAFQFRRDFAAPLPQLGDDTLHQNLGG
jgi:hypothetical protein